MRVLHVITGLATGGAERQLQLLLRHLPVESAVVTLTNAGLVADALEADGVPVTDLGMRGNRDLAALPRLARIIRRGRWDVVHTHLYRACVYGRIAARLAGVRAVVATEHSLGETRLEGRRLTAGVRALYLATERLGRATVAVSDPVARRLVEWGVDPGRVVTVPNGIDAVELAYDAELRAATRARLGLRPGQRVVAAVGRLDPGKRFDLLVRALPELDATLLLVGAGPERARLAELAGRLGVADRTVLVGETADVRPLLCAADVLASPSPEETFGLAVLEGLACGLPVVYARCPALEALPATAAPAATRVDPDPASLRAALASPPATDRRAPPAVAHYAIDRLAGRIADLYEHVRHERGLGCDLRPTW